MKNSLFEIAQDENLTCIETTTGSNGYPQHLKPAIIGFDNFEDAEKLAEEFGLEIQIFTKKDGQQLYSRTGNRAYEPLKNSCEDYGDNYSQFGYGITEEEFFNEEVKDVLNTFDNFEELQNFINDKKEIFKEIERAEEGQLVITQMGRYYETIQKESMHFYHDTKTWVIGVIKP
jgi:hypothetical protein